LQREERVPVAGLRVREERVWALIPIMVQPTGSRLSAAVWMIAGRLKAAPKGGGEAAGPDLKQKITAARHRAGLSVNRELVLLYWAIGCDILGRQEREGWGAKVIDLLAGDLGKAFPEMTGLSARNLKYMRAFAKAWGP
jgi:hypothetical protein